MLYISKLDEMVTMVKMVSLDRMVIMIVMIIMVTKVIIVKIIIRDKMVIMVALLSVTCGEELKVCQQNQQTQSSKQSFMTLKSQFSFI